MKLVKRLSSLASAGLIAALPLAGLVQEARAADEVQKSTTIQVRDHRNDIYGEGHRHSRNTDPYFLCRVPNYLKKFAKEQKVPLNETSSLTPNVKQRARDYTCISYEEGLEDLVEIARRQFIEQTWAYIDRDSGGFWVGIDKPTINRDEEAKLIYRILKNEKKDGLFFVSIGRSDVNPKQVTGNQVLDYIEKFLSGLEKRQNIIPKRLEAKSLPSKTREVAENPILAEVDKTLARLEEEQSRWPKTIVKQENEAESPVSVWADVDRVLSGPRKASEWQSPN